VWFLIDLKSNKITLLTESQFSGVEIALDISVNPEYAAWLLSFSNNPVITVDDYTYNTVYEVLFNNNRWFYSNMHTNTDKYYIEMKKNLEKIDKFHQVNIQGKFL
jgi:hypothetical protein